MTRTVGSWRRTPSWLAASVAVVVLLVVLPTVALNQRHHPVASVGPALTTHRAGIEYWGLVDGIGYRVVVRVHTGCQKIVGTAERLHYHKDWLSVLVAGPVDCGAYPLTTLTRLTIKNGAYAYGCGEDAGLIFDANTGRLLAPAPGRAFATYNCPQAMGHAPSASAGSDHLSSIRSIRGSGGSRQVAMLGTAPQGSKNRR